MKTCRIALFALAMAGVLAVAAGAAVPNFNAVASNFVNGVTVNAITNGSTITYQVAVAPGAMAFNASTGTTCAVAGVKGLAVYPNGGNDTALERNGVELTTLFGDWKTQAFNTGTDGFGFQGGSAMVTPGNMATVGIATFPTTDRKSTRLNSSHRT